MAAHGGKRPNSGRKKGSTDERKKALRELITDSDVKLALDCLRSAIKNDKSLDASKYLIDQKFGKPRQSVDMEHSGEMIVLIDDIPDES